MRCNIIKYFVLYDEQRATYWKMKIVKTAYGDTVLHFSTFPRLVSVLSCLLRPFSGRFHFSFHVRFAPLKIEADYLMNICTRNTINAQRTTLLFYWIIITIDYILLSLLSPVSFHPCIRLNNILDDLFLFLYQCGFLGNNKFPFIF